MSIPTLPRNRAQAHTARPSRWLGAFLLAEALLSLAPLMVLGPAIGWPASLTLPAAEQLTRLAAQPQAVAIGYALYLTYSVAIAPLFIAYAARVLGGLHQPLALTVAIFASLSALARALGILRWLTVMPWLANSYAHADGAARSQLELVFSAIHLYGGGIGEVLGVGLFMSIAMLLLSLGAARRSAQPHWLSGLGLVAAAAQLAVALPALGFAFKAPPSVAAMALLAWMLGAAGVFLLIQNPRTIHNREPQ